MNPKVQELIDKKKEEEREKELKLRNEHLISLGLVDEELSKKEYTSYYSNSTKYDEEKKLYYIERNVAIEVTDEEYAEICKYYPAYNNIEENIFTDIKMRKDISSIKFWVKFWSIFSIVCAAIAFFVLIANI